MLTIELVIMAFILGVLITELNYFFGGIMLTSGVVGYSLGDPYCMNCVILHTKLLDPKPQDLSMHIVNGRVAVHRVVNVSGGNYTFEFYEYNTTKTYTVNQEQILTKVLWLIPWKTTESFREVCVLEHKMYGLDTEYCEDKD